MSQSYTTKQKIINAAIKIFAQKGFWQARVSDIVKKAGVAQGTFYLYFKSKNDCFKEILLFLHSNTLDLLKSKINNNYSYVEIIKIFINRIYEVKDITKVFLFEAVSSGNEFQKLYFEFKNNFKNIFKEFISPPYETTKLSMLTGFLMEIIEQDILFEEKPKQYIFQKIDEFILLFNGDY